MEGGKGDWGRSGGPAPIPSYVNAPGLLSSPRMPGATFPAFAPHLPHILCEASADPGEGSEGGSTCCSRPRLEQGVAKQNSADTPTPHSPCQHPLSSLASPTQHPHLTGATCLTNTISGGRETYGLGKKTNLSSKPGEKEGGGGVWVEWEAREGRRADSTAVRASDKGVQHLTRPFPVQPKREPHHDPTPRNINWRATNRIISR